jgi:hypothetical protein
MQTHSTDRYDMRPFYMDPDRCGLCGCLIVCGDTIQDIEVVEVYNPEKAELKESINVRWHYECALEYIQQ